VTDAIVRMPKLADTLVEGTLAQWLKDVGAPVSRGEPLASIETDKVTTELTSPSDGTLLEVLVPAGTTVPIETPIARIGSATVTTAPAPRKVTPLAARMLAEHGLTPDQVPATSLRLKRDDVLAFVATRPEPAPLSSMRRAIAEHMTRAYQSIPHGQTVMAADLTQVVHWRDDQDPRPTFTVLFVYALARALEPPADVGVAVALQAGLIVPVVRSAHLLSVSQTTDAIGDLAARARANQLQLAETQGARMTVTNVGSFGNLTAAPIIPLGQIGILGPGLVERRPMATAEGGVRPGWRCLLSFGFDRRAFDDFAADRFLRKVIDRLLAIPTT
jgi:pyruvate/2-oxoglutarate dehydrogenase complex dihydrolipoamide acyltransferase (E2) component